MLSCFFSKFFFEGFFCFPRFWFFEGVFFVFFRIMPLVLYIVILFKVVAKAASTVATVCPKVGGKLVVKQGVFKPPKDCTKKLKGPFALGDLHVPNANTSLGSGILLKRIRYEDNKHVDIYVVNKAVKGGVEYRLVLMWRHPADEDSDKNDLMMASLALAAEYDKEWGADLCNIAGYTDFLAYLTMSNYFVCANQPRHFSYSYPWSYSDGVGKLTDTSKTANGKKTLENNYCKTTTNP